jgi:hypothetical protein
METIGAKLNLQKYKRQKKRLAWQKNGRTGEKKGRKSGKGEKKKDKKGKGEEKGRVVLVNVGGFCGESQF